MRIKQGYENALVSSGPKCLFRDSSCESVQMKKTWKWLFLCSRVLVCMEKCRLLLLVQFKQRRRGCTRSVKSWERNGRGRKKGPEVSAGILIASIMHTIIGSNWGAIILHLQLNVSLKARRVLTWVHSSPVCFVCVLCTACGKSPG